MTTMLKAQKREGTGKGVARKLRQEGRVPAVLYGRELGTMHLSLDIHEAENLFYSISTCLLYTSPSPRDGLLSRMPSCA